MSEAAGESSQWCSASLGKQEKNKKRREEKIEREKEGKEGERGTGRKGICKECRVRKCMSENPTNPEQDGEN